MGGQIPTLMTATTMMIAMMILFMGRQVSMQTQSGIFKICGQKLLCRQKILSSVDVNFLCVADKRSRLVSICNIYLNKETLNSLKDLRLVCLL